MTQTPPAGEGARPETLERSVRSRMAPRVAPRVAPRIVPRLVQAPGDLALQLLLLRASESMGNHDSNVVGAGRVG
jgi:hypothetical protein